MDKTKRIKLKGLQLFTHYAFPLLILLAPILTAVNIIKILTTNYDGVRTISELAWFSIPFLLIGFLLIYRQHRRLFYKEIKISHTDHEFQYALGKTIAELKWRVEKNRTGFFRAYRVGWDGPRGWGEMITIISDNETILINSVSDPNQSPTPSSFGWDKKNVRTFIQNLQIIKKETSNG